MRKPSGKKGRFGGRTGRRQRIVQAVPPLDEDFMALFYPVLDAALEQGISGPELLG